MEIFRHTRNVTASDEVSHFFRVSADRPQALLGACPAYAKTPIVACPALAVSLGLGSLRVKDESSRMHLGSFKALGGAFAVAQLLKSNIENKLGQTLNPDDLTGDQAKSLARDYTFATASAGNHGLSVAAGAKVFGAQAVIFLSETVPEAFAMRIRGLGADVVRVAGSYDASVNAAIQKADANGWQLLADGSWPGYIDPPALVMEGYMVLAEECRADFEANDDWPTHVFLQAGVGGLAASVSAHIRKTWPQQPLITIVEPDAAPCLLYSIKAGALVRADGPDSNMGRLDCKDASLIAFEALRWDADVFVTISDEEAREAADKFAGYQMPTTPSGAAGLAAIMNRDLGLHEESHCLVIVSEGPV